MSAADGGAVSLRWRIVLAMAGVAALVGALAATGSYIATSRQLYAAVDESLEARAGEVNGTRPFEDRGHEHPPPGGIGDGGCPSAGALAAGRRCPARVGQR